MSPTPPPDWRPPRPTLDRLDKVRAMITRIIWMVAINLVLTVILLILVFTAPIPN
jgi:hypothetical protein